MGMNTPSGLNDRGLAIDITMPEVSSTGGSENDQWSYVVYDPATSALAFADVIVFIHGWPDAIQIWARHVKHFHAQGFRCVTLYIPNYERPLVETRKCINCCYGMNLRE